MGKTEYKRSLHRSVDAERSAGAHRAGDSQPAAWQPMQQAERVILVIGAARPRTQKLKQLIEFMDVSDVQVANPDAWREELGDRQLAAVFLGQEMGIHAIDRLITEVGRLDRSVSIVLVDDNNV